MATDYDGAHAIMEFKIQKGSRLDNHAILTQKSKSVSSCVMKCVQLSNYKSVNYNTVNKNCELNRSMTYLAHVQWYGPSEDIYIKVKL